MIFGNDIEYRLCMLNSKVNTELLKVLCPTMKFEVGAVALIPVGDNTISETKQIATHAINISKTDWDSFETSWDFERNPLLSQPLKMATVEESFELWDAECNSRIQRLQDLETNSNSLFIESYGLHEQLTPQVLDSQVTLARPNCEVNMKQLVSYAIGCMMGRYSLDEPGLAYAQSGNEGFDPSKYKSVPADDDGIVPILDQDWFNDDGATRFEEFLKAAWPPETLEENLAFVAAALKPRKNEAPIHTIRRYLCAGFYKDHLKSI